MPAPKGTGKRRSPPPTTPKSTRGNPSRGKSWEESRQNEVRKLKSDDIVIESDSSIDSDSDDDTETEETARVQRRNDERKRKRREQQNGDENITLQQKLKKTRDIDAHFGTSNQGGANPVLFGTSGTYTEATIIEQLKRSEPAMRSVINGFVMKSIFPTLKFPIEKMLGNILLSARSSNPVLTLGGGISTVELVEHFKGKVSTAFSELRHSTQTNSRTNYLKDARMGKIPRNFPDNVLMVRQNYKETGQSKYTLHDNYRRGTTEEFLYFAKRILPCVNARHTNFRTKSRIKTLSEVFTASDEAYALALLINEFENYQFKLLNDKDGATRPRKPFTSSASGCKKGWNHHGLKTFTLILKEVKQRRKEKFSEHLENTVKESCSNDAGRATKTKKAVIVEEFDFSEHLEGNELLLGYLK